MSITIVILFELFGKGVSNMIYSVGRKIRDLRLYYDISQKDLAKNICSQAMISQIENDERIATANLLYDISMKLGVDLNYFFCEYEAPKISYMKETFRHISRHIRSHNYAEANELIKTSLVNPLFKQPSEQKQLLWQKGVCHYYLTSNFEESASYLDQALNIETNANKTTSELEVQILLSLAIIHSENLKVEDSLLFYDKSLKKCLQLPKLKDPKVLIKIYYNYSKTLQEIKEYNQSIEFCDRGIKLCGSQESMYLLGELFCQKGYNLLFLDKKEECLLHIEKSIHVFELQNNHTVALYLKDIVQQIKTGKNADELIAYG